MREISYNRMAAIQYARAWALGRNPAYYNFNDIGGDCTNFASQCIFAGAQVMNYTAEVGWFYRSVSDRTPSWTGVEYLYKFLTSNRSVGPYGRVITQNEALPGDIIQLGNSSGHFYHTLVIISVFPTILVAAHSFDALNKPLSSYSYDTARFIRIEGVRDW